MYMYVPGGSDAKESSYDAGEPGLIPESERSPRGGHGNLFQYSNLENPMDRGAWPGYGLRVTKSRTQVSD